MVQAVWIYTGILLLTTDPGGVNRNDPREMSTLGNQHDTMERNKLFSIGLLAMFIIAGGHPLAAQRDNPWFGLRAGTVISRAQFEGGMLDINSSSKFGIDLAAVIDLPIGNVISIGPEVHWVQRNTGAEGDGPEENFTQKLDFIHVPLLLRLHLGRPSGLQVFGGPSLDYLLEAKVDYSDPNLMDINNKDNYTDLTLGGVLGAGIQLGPVLLDVRYNIGFGDLYDADLNDLDITTQDFGAGVTLMF